MPLMNSMGSLKQQTKYVNFNPITDTYWMNITGFKANSTAQPFTINNVNGSVWSTGINGVTSSGKQFAYTQDSSTGALSSYKVLNGILSSSGGIKGYAKDSNDYSYYILSNFTIAQYDNTGSFVSSPRFLDGGGGGLSVKNVCKGSGNNIYVLFNDNSLCKIDLLTLSFTWAFTVNTITANSSYLYMDSSENLYVCMYTTSGSVNTIMKVNSSGSVQWQTSTASFANNLINRIGVDSTGNVWLLGGSTTGTLVKLNSSGVYQSARSVPTVLGAGTYDALCVNSDNNVVLLQDYAAGSTDYTFTVTINSSYTVLNSTQIDQGGSIFLVPFSITSVGNSLYIGAHIDPTGANLATILKLPKNNDLIFSVPFSYNYTRDDSTNYNDTGTLSSTSQTNPVLSVTTATFGSTSYTTGSVSFTSSTQIVGTNATVPYNTYISIS